MYFDILYNLLMQVVKILCHAKNSAYYHGIMPNALLKVPIMQKIMPE